MKVFIYDKKTSKVVRVIRNVVEVRDNKQTIWYIDDAGERYCVDKKLFKSTAYQN